MPCSRGNRTNRFYFKDWNSLPMYPLLLYHTRIRTGRITCVVKNRTNHVLRKLQLRRNMVSKQGRSDWSHEGHREDQEIDNRTCCNHMKSESRAQTFHVSRAPKTVHVIHWEVVNFTPWKYSYTDKWRIPRTEKFCRSIVVCFMCDQWFWDLFTGMSSKSGQDM